MDRSKAFYLVIVAALVIGGGCATIRGIVQKPKVDFAGMSLREMDLFEITPIFNFEITNPNPFGVLVKKVTYNLKVNDNKFINGVADKGVRLPAGGVDVVSVPVTINYLDVFETFTEFNSRNKLTYNLSGAVGVGPFNIPYKTRGTLDVPDLPKISLKNVEMSDVSLTNASMRFTIDIENNNPFAVKLNGLDYGIKLSGKEFATGKVEAAEIPAVDGKGITTVKIPMNVNFFKLGRSVYNLLKENTSGYELSGEMMFDIPKRGKKRVPFRQEGNVPLKK